ncbi:MAG TPA: hypothetical protein VEB69_15425 [Acidimicrobiia bacterium]|nr:hypothetical protein [Acidimicrobiia bacterium]
MSIRGRFLRELSSSTPSNSGLVRHAGHELADQVRETIGTLAGGGEGGRLAGHSVYNLLEDEATSKRPKRDADFGNEHFRSGSPA